MIINCLQECTSSQYLFLHGQCISYTFHSNSTVQSATKRFFSTKWSRHISNRRKMKRYLVNFSTNPTSPDTELLLIVIIIPQFIVPNIDFIRRTFPWNFFARHSCTSVLEKCAKTSIVCVSFIILPAVCWLHIQLCGEVNLRLLGAAFPGVTDLEMWNSSLVEGSAGGSGDLFPRLHKVKLVGVRGLSILRSVALHSVESVSVSLCDPEDKEMLADAFPRARIEDVWVRITFRFQVLAWTVSDDDEMKRLSAQFARGQDKALNTLCTTYGVAPLLLCTIYGVFPPPPLCSDMQMRIKHLQLMYPWKKRLGF